VLSGDLSNQAKPIERTPRRRDLHGNDPNLVPKLGGGGFGPARNWDRHDDVIDTFASVSQERIERTAHSGEDHVVHGASAAVTDRANLGQIGTGDAEAAPGSHRAVQ
jgi:hypothetical protein